MLEEDTPHEAKASQSPHTSSKPTKKGQEKYPAISVACPGKTGQLILCRN